MKDGNEPKQANEKMKPQQQEGEEFGQLKAPRARGNRIRTAATPRAGASPKRAARRRG